MSFSRRQITVAAIFTSLVVVYAAAGFWGVPWLARSQLQKFAALTLHRPLAVGKVQFNPFTLELSINDFALQEVDGKPLLAFRQLYINAELASLWQRRVNLAEVRLNAPAINIGIDTSGKLNLAHLLPASDSPEPAPAAALPLVRIGLVSVNEGQLAFNDLSKGAAYQSQLQQLSLAVKEFRTDANYKNSYSLATDTALQEHAEMTGDFVIQPLAASGSFAVKQLQLPPLAAYLAAALPFQLADGKLSLDGQFSFAAANTPSTAPLWQLSLSKATARDVAIAEHNAVGSKPAIVIPAITANDIAVTPANRLVSIRQAVLQSPSIEVQRDSAGIINLARMFHGNDEQAPLGNAQTATESNTAAAGTSNQTPAASPWQLQLVESRIETATVAITDNSVTPVARFAITPVDLQIANLNTGSDPMHLTGTAVIDHDSHLSLAGDIGLMPLKAGVTIDLDNFSLSSLQPYLMQPTQLTLESGLLSIHGRFGNDNPQAGTDAADHADTGNTTFKFAGDISIDNLHSADRTNGKPFVYWKQVAVAGIKVAVDPATARLASLAIGDVLVDAPYANIMIAADKSINVSHVLSASTTQKAAAPSTAASKAPATERSAADAALIKIGTIKIMQGSADFADHSIEPGFVTGMVDLTGTVSGLSSQAASRAAISLQGKVDKLSPVAISGDLNPLAAHVYSDLALKFSNIELTTFNPYSGKYAGYNISKGKLTAGMHYLIKDRKLEAEHHVVIDNLEFGNATDSKDAAPIPIKLAVALLKDRDGVITVDLPVSGTLDDPQFRLAPLIWKACLGVLRNVASAPFAALGKLFGSSEPLGLVEFQPGMAQLSSAESSQLTTLAKALVERPALKLSIPLNSITAADSDAMAQQALLALLPAGTDAAAKAAQLAALEMEYMKRGGQPLTAPASAADATPAAAEALLDSRIQLLKQALMPLLKPDADALTELGRQRANAVQSLLLTNTALAAERVFLVNDEVAAANAPAKGPAATVIKMTLHLE